EGRGPLAYSPHIQGHADQVLGQICSSGYEGIVAKRADAPYRSGRTKAWLKVKCTRRQEFVIGGWSRTDKKNRPLPSILVGVMEEGRLVYKGRVGSSEGNTLQELAPQLFKRERKTSPFASLPREARRDAVF